MIYSNFLYFIVAIILFSSAPQSNITLFSVSGNPIWLILMVFLFWQLNRLHFKRLRVKYDNEIFDLSQAKREYYRLIGLNTVIAIFLFAIELFMLNLKGFLVNIPLLGELETLLNAGGLLIFLLHLSIVWFWSFRTMGDILSSSASAGDYIRSQIKFNLVIVIPWLMLSLLIDFLFLVRIPFIQGLLDSAISQIAFVGVLLFIIALFAPVLITRLWDCQPLAESELKENILEFCHSQGVKFKKIMSWNALNRGLITAGVVGLVKPFRYLLITPGLINMLSPDETLAVVSHEVGHVKKKHLLYYLGFFIGFMILIFSVLDRLLNLFLNTRLGFSLVFSADGGFNLSFLSFLRIFISLFLFIFYFRFVFGYFMRNFEREADLYCFQSGINPVHLIASFMKLGARLGDDGKRKNWHHYNIGQRIDYIRKSMENPKLIQTHKKKVRRSLNIFVVALVIFTVLSFNPLASQWDNVLVNGVVEKLIEKNPDNAQYYSYLAMLYYEQKKWAAARDVYEKSIRLNPNQAESLNNLAWLYLKCPAREFLDFERALKLAQEAFRLKRESFILDTLAEAYLANGLYKEALATARQALEMAGSNRGYYRKQLKKMQSAYKTLEKSIAI